LKLKDTRFLGALTQVCHFAMCYLSVEHVFFIDAQREIKVFARTNNITARMTLHHRVKR
jgi:hypothetical protein